MSLQEQAQSVLQTNVELQNPTRLYIRDRCPMPDESGLVHPKTLAGLYLRDSDTIDMFLTGDMGTRWDKQSQSKWDRMKNHNQQGQRWAGVFQESYALETNKSIYLKTKQAFWKVRDSFLQRIQSVFQVSAKEDVAFGGKRLWQRFKEQVVIIALNIFSVETNNLRLKTSHGNIGIQGHYFDKYVLYTEEMYQDILKIKNHLNGLKTVFDTHIHVETNVVPKAPQPDPTIGDYDDPLIKPWPGGEKPLPAALRKEMDAVDECSWDYLSESEWGESPHD